jgi:hypothetical protein
MVVKSWGRGTGLQGRGKTQQFPKFETFREQIDGKFWFPTYTVANDTLWFDNGGVPIKLTVRYEDYKQFKTDVKIIVEGEEEPPAKPAAPAPPKPKP